jgi:predicted dehydrogenase
MSAPAISAKEALLTEIEHFVDCIEAGTRPITDGASGLRVIELLEAATASTQLRGQPIELGGLRKAS